MVFGKVDKQKGPWDKYIGKHIIIISKGMCYPGKLVDIIDGYQALLNPFVRTIYTERGPVKELFRDKTGSTINLSEACVEPTTRKSIENSVAHFNNNNDQAEKDRNRGSQIVIARR